MVCCLQQMHFWHNGVQWHARCKFSPWGFSVLTMSTTTSPQTTTTWRLDTVPQCAEQNKQRILHQSHHQSDHCDNDCVTLFVNWVSFLCCEPHPSWCPAIACGSKSIKHLAQMSIDCEQRLANVEQRFCLS